MKNVCFLLASLQAGGLENYLVRFVEHVPKGELNILIICRSGQTGVLTERAEAGGATVVAIPGGHLNVTAWRKLNHLFKIHDIESICDFTGNFSAIPLLIGRMQGIANRMAYYPRSSDAFRTSFFNRIANRLFNQIVYKNATSIVANSNAGLKHFFSNYNFDARFQVIYNGIDASAFVEQDSSDTIRSEFGIPPDAFVVGHVGRYNVAKNHPTVVAVGERLIKWHPQVYVVLCGKETEKALEEIDDPTVRKRMFSLGYRSDVARVLQSFDLFLFPSITEGQPNALLEAMIANLPFLSSNIPSILEAIPERFHGQTYEPLDVKGFTDRITELIESPAQMDNMKCPNEARLKFDAKKNFGLLREAMRV